MRSAIIFMLLLLVLCACRKNQTCTCVTENTVNPDSSGTTVETIHATKSDAEIACSEKSGTTGNSITTCSLTN